MQPDLTPILVGQLDPASPDAPVAAHYGDPLREQRVTGLVDRSHRGALALTGPERLPFLHNLASQHMLSLADGQSTQALILSPHGHIEHHLWVTELDSTLWVETEPGTLPALRDFLTKMRFLSQVEIEESDLASYTILGRPGGFDLPAPRVLPEPGPKFATGSVPPQPTSAYGVQPLDSGGFARRTPLGVDLLLPPQAPRPDLPPVGLWAYEAARVAARQPRLGFETDHRTLPSEVGLTAVAVHLEKGCYRGQETVARVHHLGRPPRALRLLHLDGITTDELPAPGTPIKSGERTVGFVGTAVRHYELGPVALGLVKRNISAETPLVAGESSVAIESEDD